jgi:hypothetical protein
MTIALHCSAIRVVTHGMVCDRCSGGKGVDPFKDLSASETSYWLGRGPCSSK